MPRLILIGNKHSVSTIPLQKAFNALGWDVRIIDPLGHPALMPRHPLHRLIEKLPASIKLSLRAKLLRNIDEHIWHAAQTFQPDIIFVIKAKLLGSDLLVRLRTIAKTANWYSETMDHWDTLKKIAPQYDFLFNFDPYVVEKLKGEGHQNVFYLPFCADIAKDAVWQESKPKYNITFVGSYLSSRYEGREEALEQVKDLGLHIWGNKEWKKTKLASYYRGWLPGYENVAEIYRDSKIVINVHLTEIPGSGMNFRPFEIAAAGSLLLNHSGRKDIFNLFESGKEFIPFDGPEDIRALAEYYLKHEEERKAIAKAGFERVQRDHTYTDRARTIIETMNAS